MKKLVIFISFTALLFSCQQTELEFSCDPVINKFVIENHDELSNVTVQEVAAYDLQLQKAIFASWDHQKKRGAWIDKLQYVKANTSFTELEKFHIQALIDHINEDYFLKENLDKNSEIRSQFASQWLNYAHNKLGWTDQFIAFMVYRLYTNQAQFDSELSAIRTIGTTVSTNSESGNCTCSVSSDYCGSSTCSSNGCTTSSGCGWLWSESCDGRCY
jgi:hypothetical protein